MLPTASEMRSAVLLFLLVAVSLSSSDEGGGNGLASDNLEFIDLSREDERPSIDAPFLRSDHLFLAVYSLQVDLFPSVCAVNASLSVQRDPGNAAEYEPACILTLLGDQETIELVSNTVVSFGDANAYLTFLVDGTGKVELPSDQFYKELEKPVLITGAVLFSTGPCVVSGNVINVTLCPEREINSGLSMLPARVPNVTALLSQESVNSDEFNIIALERLATDKVPFVPLQMTLFATPPTSESTSTGATTAVLETPSLVAEVVAPIVTFLVVVALVTVLVVIGVRYWYTRSHRLKLIRQKKNSIAQQHQIAARLREPFLDRSVTDSLRNNPAYAGFRLVCSEDPSILLPDDSTGYTEIELASRKHMELTKREEEEEEEVQESSASNFVPKFGVLVPQYNFYDYNTKRSSEIEAWEYARTDLIYMRDLGEGEFGKVVLMKAKGISGYGELIPVAVKTLSSTEQRMRERFLEEVELMRKFIHPHIVSLLGVCLSSEDKSSAPLMILEYMPYGDLRYFLNTYKPADGGKAAITLTHFYSFAVDVAKALEFLAENKYVHRDMAARNCLVGPSLRIKIADFGLARGVNENDYYQVTGRAVLPIRWMAPESLLFGRFSTSSDVWSYGVVLWEIVSYGETPLKGLDPKQIMQQHIKEAVFHARPDNCPEVFYTLMLDCFDYNEDNRPSFTDILGTLRRNRMQSCSSVLSVV